MQQLVAGVTVELLLDGVAVGTVTVQGIQDSWGYGIFEPAPGFAEFAPLFGRWSLLMHADDDGEEMSEDLAEELRGIEATMTRVHASFCIGHGAEIPLALVNIDGPLVEWKHG